MEWVETTGHSVEEAKRYALEQLGVGEADAEVEVLAEPKTGLFGRLKEEARVRARVRPRYPRAKAERRDRRRRPGGSTATPAREAPRVSSAKKVEARREGHANMTSSDGATEHEPLRRRTRRSSTAGGDSSPAAVVAETPLPEQIERGEEFLKGLLAELGVPATVLAHQTADDTVELSIEGDDLGALIGPKGATLVALQELTRAVLQRRGSPSSPRLALDVNGYRKRRQEALVRFVQSVAAEVRATKSRHALEPMNAADRKTVHDAINSISGVGTISEGEDPHRRVVIVPTDAPASPGENPAE
jgi:spoIIIJ-associated protein